MLEAATIGNHKKKQLIETLMGNLFVKSVLGWQWLWSVLLIGLWCFFGSEMYYFIVVIYYFIVMFILFYFFES